MVKRTKKDEELCGRFRHRFTRKQWTTLFGGGPVLTLREADNVVNEIINIHLETDLSEFTSTVTDSGDLSWSNDATAQAVASTSGAMSCLIDDTTAIYGQKTVTTDTSGTIRFRFYIDPNSISIPDTNVVRNVYLYTSGGIVFAWVGLYYYTATGYRIALVIYNDAGGTDFIGSSSTHLISDAPHYIECQITKSDGSNNGTAEIWIDGTSQASETGKDNDTRFADFSYIRIGAVVVPASVSGTIYLDELAVNNDGSEIGPV